MKTPLKTIDESLKRNGYNVRERCNIYAGTILGMTIPIVATRHLVFPSVEGEYAILKEAALWGTSIAINITASVFTKGFPLLYSTLGGLSLGGYCAQELKRERLKEKNNALE